MLILGSCINDDLSNCWYGRHLHFQTINNKYEFKSVVEKVDLYIYNKNGNLEEIKTYYKEELRSSDYKIYISDEHKKTEYEYIALVNQMDYYQTNNYEEMKTFVTEIIADNKNIVKNKLTDIFYGSKTIDFDNKISDTDTIYLIKNTNNINLSVKYEEGVLQNEESLNTYINGTNGKYDVENKPTGGVLYTYLPYSGETMQTMSDYKFTTMRLWRGGDATVYIEKHPNENIENVTHRQFLNITETLASVTGTDGEKLYDTNEKLERYDEFDIEVFLDSNFAIAKIIIGDWEYIYNEEEI